MHHPDLQRWRLGRSGAPPTFQASNPSALPVPHFIPRSLPAGAAFPVLAALLFALFFAASAPSPLFIVFQHAWGFSSSMLTLAFAVYTLALLASRLIAGALSDHVGRSAR